MSLDSKSDTSENQLSRFTSQAHTAEDLLKSQTVGLVNLSDFRRRRAEALEQKERETSSPLGQVSSSRSGTATPSEGVSTPAPPTKKKRKAAAKGKLSFALDDEEDSQDSARSKLDVGNVGADSKGKDASKKRLGANSSAGIAPKVSTKAALLREAQTREQLRKDYLIMQEAVKATEFLIPFVFYDGTNIPGGVCKVKKGDHVWLFLDRSRKVGAELGANSTEKSDSRREWARISVDDLMLVRREIIIPQHYEFYYFIVNKTIGHESRLLFPYSTEPPASALDPAPSLLAADANNLSTYDPLSRPKKSSTGLSPLDTNLEGFNEDPGFTKVVDRRWYERNKHIFPASMWEEFDPGKDYSKSMRRDAEGNAFFFS